jgi:hypothetical protein
LKTSLVADIMAEFISNAARNAGRTSAILKRIYEKNVCIRTENGGKISDEI